MQTKLSRICDAIMEAGWLAALIVTPLFFNTSSNRVFEPDKLHLVRSIALVMLVAWIAQLFDTGLKGQARRGAGAAGGGLLAAIRHTPLILPTLALVGAYLLSTVLGLIPHISFFGSYVRMQGTYTFISYVLIFLMVLTHLRSRAQLNRIFYAVILTSLPIAIYGIIQHFGQDPLPWGGDVRERVAANMGNSIFVAAYLIMAVFLTIERLVDSVAALLDDDKGTTGDSLRAGAYFFILMIQIIAIVFTQSRGPQLGLLAGGYMFVMLGFLLMVRWARNRRAAPGALAWFTRHVRAVWVALLGVTLAGIALLVVMNVPRGPLQDNVCTMRYVGRFCTLTRLDGTNAVRVLIWEGVVDLMLKPHAPLQQPDGTPDALNIIRPLIGYGPESLWVSFNRFYPPDLAHYEARNASPDRAHNETFDTLSHTGLLGFGLQLWLYVSVFYFALRWLGLLSGKGQRNLFLGFLGGGAALGVIIPLIVDRSPRLAGIGLPGGLLAGLLLYVTVDLLLSPAGRTDDTVTSDGAMVAGGRRQLLILTILAAIIAHFFEIHLGIAIASTLTTFWVLAAVLVAVGLGWVNPTADAAEPASDLLPANPASAAAAPPRPIAPAQPVAASSSRRGNPAGAQAARSASPSGARRTSQRSPTAPPRSASDAKPASPIRTFLPYAGIVALVSLVLTWNFLVNQAGAKDPLTIWWNSFTLRTDPGAFKLVAAPMLLVMLLFTWGVGALVAIAEHARLTGARGGAGAVVNGVLYLGVAFLVWFVYGLIQANRLILDTYTGLAVFRHIATHIVVFDALLLGLIVALAIGLLAADTRRRPARFSQMTPLVPLLGGAGAAALALAIIAGVNIQTVQADTHYKQGLAYETAGSWEGAAILHAEAARLQPAEDYYYLFIGRSLLQLAGSQPVGTTVLPNRAEIAKLPTENLLAVIDRGLRSRNREDMMRASFAALLGAQKLNPYNTDHAANLARHSRSWAFTNALGPSDTLSNASLHQIVATRPKDVDLEKLKQSLEYYRQATSLSPQNAQLWNELATTQFIAGDVEAAKATLDRSAAIDPIFSQTFILRGDLLATVGDKAGAAAAYRKAAELLGGDPAVWSAVGVYSAQAGDTAGSLAAFQKLLDIQKSNLAATQKQLSDLETQVALKGGYGALGAPAAQNRDSLQASIASHRSQLVVTLRNTAVVLRDLERLPEAIESARAAITFATDSERTELDALIKSLQEQGK